MLRTLTGYCTSKLWLIVVIVVLCCSPAQINIKRIDIPIAFTECINDVGVAWIRLDILQDSALAEAAVVHERVHIRQIADAGSCAQFSKRTKLQVALNEAEAYCHYAQVLANRGVVPNGTQAILRVSRILAEGYPSLGLNPLQAEKLIRLYCEEAKD